MKIQKHAACEGTGKVPHTYAGTTRNCLWCKGLGFVNSDFRPFKSERGLKMAKKKFTCSDCKGSGIKTYSANYKDRCRECSGTGFEVIEAHVGDILPTEIDRCDYVPRAIWPELFAEMTVEVVRQNRGISWAESYLGVGLFSVTDYGTGWDSDPTTFLDQVKEKIATYHHQWTKILDQESREILSKIVILLNTAGYSVVAAKTKPARENSLEIVGMK